MKGGIFMTSNQIAYWTLEETRRANKANETETKRHNTVGEGISSASLMETSRHNQATEGVDLGKLQETIRHNSATELEANRHNLVGEAQNQQQISESRRHNYATEGISSQANALRAAELEVAKDRNTYLNYLDEARASDIYASNPLAYAFTISKDPENRKIIADSVRDASNTVVNAVFPMDENYRNNNKQTLFEWLVDEVPKAGSAIGNFLTGGAVNNVKKSDTIFGWLGF